MPAADYPESLKHLIRELRRMPGVGPRSAERIALWMIQSRDSRSAEIAAAILQTIASVHPCSLCGFFSTAELCAICSDSTREMRLLCVVEQPTDILPLERTGVFRGRYHSLGGRISPLEHIGPEELRISVLLERMRQECPEEVILALSADVEGEATASYLAAALREHPVRISRIAQGLPAGGGLEFADELTISRALSGRREV